MYRRTVAKINYALKKIAVVLLFFYQCLISPFLGCNCRFYPTCSEYAAQAIRIHGFWVGMWLAIKRLSKCHPLHSGGDDPVPQNKHFNLYTKQI